MNRDWVRLKHAHLAEFQDDFAFWSSLAGRTGGPILELGCGAGRLFPSLARAGAVVGLDIDGAALGRARRASSGHHHPVHLVQADASALPLAGSFALIAMACNGFAHLSPAQAETCLRGAFLRLLPGGVFAAELPSPADTRGPFTSLPAVGQFVEPESQHPVQISARTSRRGTEQLVTWIYDELLPDGRVLRHEALEHYQIWTPSRLMAVLDRAGFRAIEYYGDYRGGAFDPQSETWLMLAHK